MCHQAAKAVPDGEAGGIKARFVKPVCNSAGLAEGIAGIGLADLADADAVGAFACLGFIGVLIGNGYLEYEYTAAFLGFQQLAVQIQADGITVGIDPNLGFCLGTVNIPTAADISTNNTLTPENWTDYLKFASRFYKYSYTEQIGIYYQRPDATAVASYEIWNQQMRRYVKRGSVGIAILDASEDGYGFRYLFDIADTGTRRNSWNPNIWTMLPEHEDSIVQYLDQKYAIPIPKLFSILYAISAHQ